MDLRAGAVAVGQVFGWTLARTWLAILLGAGTVAAFGAYGQSHPLPAYGTGLAIIDQQMQRSRELPPADVLVLGDSASLYGVDPVALEQQLGGARVASLAAIGPVRPPGYAKLLLNHVAHQETPGVVLLLLHPLGLVQDMGTHKRPEMDAVLAGAWPAESFTEEAVKALNFHLFRGLLEEPIEGEHGRYYGNGSQLRRSIDAHGGSLVFPARMPLMPQGPVYPHGMRYEINEDGRHDLARMADELRGIDRSRLYVGLTPVPAALTGELTEPSRAQVLREILSILGLPAGQAVELPSTLPDAEFGDLTHPIEPGRARLTAALVPILRGALQAKSSAQPAS